MRKRFVNFWLLQKLSWKALWTDESVMAKSLKLAALEHQGAQPVSDEHLMKQAFRDKLAGKSNEESAAMRELSRRHGL